MPKAKRSSQRKPRKRKYPGDCYRQAANYVLDHPKATLVHGTIETALGWPIAHAWAEEGERVWDGSMAEWFEEAEFYERFRATPERTYTQQRTRWMMLQYKHYGSWHESAGSYRDKDGSLVLPKVIRDQFDMLRKVWNAAEQAGLMVGKGASDGGEAN